MQDILRSEEQCRDFCNKAINWLLKFRVPGKKLFRVNYVAGESEATTESPNATCMLISREVPQLSDLARTHANTKDWADLVHFAREAAKKVSSTPPHEVLPLHSYGVLPLFSTCYFARLIAPRPDGTSTSTGYAALANPAYAIAMRRILLALDKELKRSWEVPSDDHEHPFILHGCAEALAGLRAQLQAAFENRDTAAIGKFWANTKDDDLLRQAVKKRTNKLPQDEALQKIFDSHRWRRLQGKLSKLTQPGTPRQFHPHLDLILHRVQEVAKSSAIAQIASQSSSVGFDLDPSALVFSLAILSSSEVPPVSLLKQGLEVVLGSQQRGSFNAMPFFAMNRGAGAMFAPSVEIASTALDIFLKHADDKFLLEPEAILEASAPIQQHLCDHYNAIKIISNKQEKQLFGWSSDKSPSRARVDAWVTIHALSFFLRRLELIRLVNRKRILQNYTWKPARKCSPQWKDLVDPNLGRPADRQIKPQIDKAFAAKMPSLTKAKDPTVAKAPVFILYGPPGTSKTTIVEAVAQKMKWDLIMLSPSDFLAEDFNGIEHTSRRIFDDLLKLDNSIILFDEMDSLFRDRDHLKQKATGSLMEIVVPAFLPKLQTLCNYAATHQIGVFFVTNYYETLDRAIRRGGRINYHILVLPYTREAKQELLKQRLSKHWGDGKAKAHEVDHALRQLVDDSDPLQCYREVESIRDAIIAGWKKPTNKRPKTVNALLSATSVLTDIYLPENRDQRAIFELSAVLERQMPPSPANNHLPSNIDDVLPHLHTFAADKKQSQEWRDLANSWITRCQKAPKH